MKKTFGIILLMVLLTASFFEGIAQKSTLKKLTLEDLYKNNVFSTKGINERGNTTLHLRMTMLNFLKKNLLAGAK
ncbi:MAG: hypothetical protein U5L09_22330 [Bacteroidales bacterium]|nr:hypothetical protein [Bacteroidales bacterium]